MVPSRKESAFSTRRIICATLRGCQRGWSGVPGRRRSEKGSIDANVLRLEDILAEPPGMGETLDVERLFARAGPIEMEIGFGKGGFLLRQARAHPERNYLGVEWANEFYRYAADRCRRWGVNNVRIIRTDARHLLIHQFPADVLSALHVYHPDPWPKRRHHKRRLFTPAFVEAAVRALKKGGRWAVQTDHAEYFEVIRSLLLNRYDLIPIDFDDPEYGTTEERTETNFEIKYLREGRPIFRLALRKT